MNRESNPAGGQSRPRLLIVDDEAHIRSGLARALGLMGYKTETARSGHEALQRLATGDLDLMILDMRMPGMSGVDVIAQIKGAAEATPIIVLTGHATVESAIAAVKTELVVDYLLKPVDMSEVAEAVARALQKRQTRQAQDRLVSAVSAAVDALRNGADIDPEGGAEANPEAYLRSGLLMLDSRRRQVTVDGDEARTVALTNGETNLLALLMSGPGSVFSYSQLARALWGYESPADEASGPVRSAIFRLRKKLERAPGQPEFIRTVRGRGYYLIGED